MNKILLMAAAMVCLPIANAAVILSPTSVVSNSAGDFESDTTIIRTIDHSGLLTNFTNGVTDFDAYLSGTPLHDFTFVNHEWFSLTGNPTGTVVYDLGSLYTVDRVALWNEDTDGLKSVDFTTATLADFSDAVGGGSMFPTNNADAADYPAEQFTLGGGARNARYVKLFLTAGGSAANGTDWLTMGEIAFSVKAVPEPSTLALLGVGVLGLIARRRRVS